MGLLPLINILNPEILPYCSYKMSSYITVTIVRRQKAKKGPEVEVEYVQTFIAGYCSLGCVP